MTAYNNVKIDNETMINMLMDHVEFWVSKFDPVYDLYEGLIIKIVHEYKELLECGYFNPEDFVDELYINNTAVCESVEDAISQGYSENNIAFQSDEGVIVWTN